MRKYLLGLFAVVMAVSLSAFTSAKSSNTAGKSADLYWFLYDATSEETGAYLGYGERSEFEEFPCDQLSGTDCRRGYPVAALTNSSDPDQGVVNANFNEDQIKKP